MCIRPKFLPNSYNCIININVYLRPQRNKYNANKILWKELRTINKDYPNAFIILTGDINEKELKVAVDFSLNNMVNFPTYYPHNSFLDAAYVSKSNIYECHAGEPIGSSSNTHHISILLTPLKTCYNKIQKPKKHTSLINKDSLKSDLENTDWSIFQNLNLNEMADTCDSYIEFLIENNTHTKSLPYIHIFQRLRPDNELIFLSKAKTNAIKRKDNHNRNILQRKITARVKQIRRQWINTMDMNEIYFLCRNLCKGENTNVLPSREDANKLNDFFTRFNMDKHKDSTLHISCDTQNCSYDEVTKNEVQNHFKNLKKTSSGISKIPYWCFKENAKELSDIYQKIYSKSFEMKQYPETWKKAIVTACPKSATATISEPKLFRPIAVTPIQARVLDKIALKRIDKLMENQNDMYQFAYKSGYSTTDALNTTIHHILKCLDDNPSCAVKAVFLDYSSAFNTVLQNRLLNKVTLNSPHFAQWLNSYMLNWSQAVKSVKNQTSEYTEVTVGIPQGGPLSAKIFTYVTNEINNASLNIDQIKGNISKYSDDTRLLYMIKYGTHQNDQRQYEEICDNIYKMSDLENLKLNCLKCEELVFTHKHLNYSDSFVEKIKENLIVNNSKIPRVEKVKYLGIIITQDLKWKQHINQIVKKVNLTIKGLAKIIPFMDMKKKIILFNTFVIPNILYASQIWGNSLGLKQKYKIKKLINFYSRISNIPKEELLIVLNNQYKERFRKYVESIISNSGHPLYKTFEETKSRHTSTRQTWSELYCRTESYRRSFVPTAVTYLRNGILSDLI